MEPFIAGTEPTRKAPPPTLPEADVEASPGVDHAAVAHDVAAAAR
jgi:hypothetical protein